MHTMNSLQKSDIKVINFKRLEPLSQGNYKRMNVDNVLMTVVVVQIGGTQNERRKMKECEQWIKKNEFIRLMKINKIEAFQPTYRLMMKQSQPVYFILLLPIEKISSQPICNLYKNQLKNGKSLSDIDIMAKDNISRIKFIVIQDQLQQLGKLSFLHSATYLVTTQTIFIFDAIEQFLRSKGKLKVEESSSSINNSEFELFANQKNEKIKEGIISPQKKVQPIFDGKKQALKMKNNTPGVGSYNIRM